MRYIARIPFSVPGMGADQLLPGTLVSKEQEQAIRATEKRYPDDHEDESLRGTPIEGEPHALHLLDHYCTRISDEAAENLERAQNPPAAVDAKAAPENARASSQSREPAPPQPQVPTTGEGSPTTEQPGKK